MLVIPRYDRVRWFRSFDDSYSLPLILDKRSREVKAAQSLDWDLFYHLNRIVRDERAIYTKYQTIGRPHLNLGGGSPGFETGASPLTATSAANLNNNYTRNVAGNAVGGRIMFVLPVTITSLYGFSNSRTGVPNDVDFEIYPSNAGAGAENRRPDASTQLAIATIDPSAIAASVWIQGVFGASLAVPAATFRWLSIGDPDGAAGDFLQMRFAISDANMDPGPYWERMSPYNTSNGWTGNPVTPGGVNPQMVVTLADGRSFGCPFTTATNITKAAGLQLGGLVENGTGYKLKVYGACFQWDTNTAFPANLRLQFWNGDDGPAGTPLDDSTVRVRGAGTGANNCPMFYVSGSSLTIEKAQRFRVGLISATLPIAIWRYDIGTVGIGNVVDLQKAMNGGGALTGGGAGGWTWTENTAGAWINTPTSAPIMQLLVEDFLGGGSSYIPTFRRRRR